MKKTVYHVEIADSAFSAAEVLKQMQKDKDKLIKLWGKDAYNHRLHLLIDYIRFNRVCSTNPTSGAK